MFTRNYYKLKKNNKLRSRVFYRRNSFDQNVVLISDVSFEQLRYPNGNYGTGTEYHYGYSDPLFTACDFLPKYNAEPIEETTAAGQTKDCIAAAVYDSTEPKPAEKVF